ncbi:MAG: FKBP-type peptidyl-prolyl cis-trans isomerase [Chitinophagales bacterium]
MKRIFLFAMTSFLSLGIMAQAVKKKSVAPPAKTNPSNLKTGDDSVSYAIGLSVANFFKQQHVQHFNPELVSKAINDNMKGGPQLMTEQVANNVMMTCMSRAQMEANKKNSAEAEVNKKAGESFLAQNKTKPGVVTLTSGLQYKVITSGTGPKPAKTDKIKCHYEGTLLDGTVFDSSIKRGTPLEMNVSDFIPGWIEALQLMPVGSKWKLYIPSNLAYGDQQSGGIIKPGSTLIFDLELIDIVK